MKGRQTVPEIKQNTNRKLRENTFNDRRVSIYADHMNAAKHSEFLPK